MPIYEYACAGCDSEFEVEQRITDDPVKTCPKCRSRRVKRLISQTSFVLKGGGWYADAYSSSKAEDKQADKQADDAKGEAGKSEVAGDAKKSSDKKSEKPASGAKKDGKKGKKGPKAAA